MDFDCWDWKAIQDNMPGPDEYATLHITGTCGKFATSDYRLELVQRQSGINPWEPFFDLVVHEPTGDALDVESDATVDQTMKISRGTTYTKVTIWYDGHPRWSADVEQASTDR